MYILPSLKYINMEIILKRPTLVCWIMLARCLNLQISSPYLGHFCDGFHSNISPNSITLKLVSPLT